MRRIEIEDIEVGFAGETIIEISAAGATRVAQSASLTIFVYKIAKRASCGTTSVV